MTPGARTPEELDLLLEDAFVLRDRAAARGLFDEHAVLTVAGGGEARGHAAIGRLLADLWGRGRAYVAAGGRVLQARDTALVATASAIHVVRRAADGSWRSAISLLDTGPSTASEDA